MNKEGSNLHSSRAPSWAGGLIRTYARTVEPIRSEEIVDVHISGKIGGVDFSISEYRKFPGRVTEEGIRSVVLKAIDRAAEFVEQAVSGNTKLRVQPLHER